MERQIGKKMIDGLRYCIEADNHGTESVVVVNWLRSEAKIS